MPDLDQLREAVGTSVWQEKPRNLVAGQELPRGRGNARATERGWGRCFRTSRDLGIPPRGVGSSDWPDLLLEPYITDF